MRISFLPSKARDLLALAALTIAIAFAVHLDAPAHATQLGPLVDAVAARPLSVPEQEKAMEAPILTAEFDVQTQAVTTTAVTVTASDVAPGNRTKVYVQNIRLSNRGASTEVCYWIKDFATSCSSTCTTSPKTCSGAGTDGDALQPKTWIPITITGDECLCAIGTATSVNLTAARVQRTPE